MSVTVAVAALAIAALVWLLKPRHAPLPAGYYDAPRRLLLTGCASGMGRRLARTLLQRGHFVAATDVNVDTLRDVARADGWPTERLLLLQLDVTSVKAWDQAMAAVVQAFGGLDCLINFAGLLIPAAVHRVSKEQIDLHADVMVKGVMYGTCAAARHWTSLAPEERQGSACHVVNLSSLGAVAPVRGVSLYQGAKAGARTFSLAAAKDLAPLGIRVTVVMPDAVATPMAELQLYHDESAMAYSGGILRLEQLEETLLHTVLPLRPMETRLGVTYTRQWGAAFADCFPSSKLVLLIEDDMRAKGLAAQLAAVRARLAAGGAAPGEKARLEQRERELAPRVEASGSGGASPRRRRRLIGRAAVAVALGLGYLAMLAAVTAATPADFAKATLAVPPHPPALGVAVEATRARTAALGVRPAASPAAARFALVTGATSGVGLEVAKALAAAGHQVLVGARSASKAEAAVVAVREAAAAASSVGGAIEIDLDLARLASVAASAQRVRQIVGRRGLSLLVCNAGTMPSLLGGGVGVTADGFEEAWGINHLGHHALARALRGELRRAARRAGGVRSRVVVVTSEHGHRHFAPRDGLPAALPPAPRGADPFEAYGVSKLSNVLHARAMARRWAADGIDAFAAHPGIVPTSLGQLRASGVVSAMHNAGVWLWWRVLARPVTESVAMGAASVVYAALSPQLDGHSGAYVLHCRRAQPSAAALDQSAAERLWSASDRAARSARRGSPARAVASREAGARPMARPAPSRVAAETARASLDDDDDDDGPFGATRPLLCLARHLAVYAVAYGLAVAFLFGPPFSPRLWRYKFEPREGLDATVLRRELWYGVGSVVALTAWDVLIRRDAALGGGITQLSAALELSWVGWALLVLAMGFLGDAHFYWVHRLLHASPWLYRTVHKVHHLSRNPNPLSGLAFHPIEAMLYFSSLPLLACMLPMSPAVYAAQKYALLLFPIAGHCGFGSTEHPLLAWLNHSHYLHHKLTHCNYGGLPWWDRLCGTDHATWARRNS